MVSSPDLVRLSGQVEGEVQRVASKVDEFTASLISLQDAVATCSSQYSHFEIALTSSWTTMRRGATPR